MLIEQRCHVAAPGEVVWSVIADFQAYEQWNPFVLRCQTVLEPGADIVMTVRLGSRVLQQTERVSAVELGRYFSYTMKPVPGLLTSLREHIIEPGTDEASCWYTSRFQLRGLASPVLSVLMGKDLRRGFSTMTEALVSRAEQQG